MEGAPAVVGGSQLGSQQRRVRVTVWLSASRACLACVVMGLCLDGQMGLNGALRKHDERLAIHLIF